MFRLSSLPNCKRPITVRSRETFNLLCRRKRSVLKTLLDIQGVTFFSKTETMHSNHDSANSEDKK